VARRPASARLRRSAGALAKAEAGHYVPRGVETRSNRRAVYLSVKFTVTVITTATGVPFSNVGVNSH
jgi:hypothetical protein